MVDGRLFKPLLLLVIAASTTESFKVDIKIAYSNSTHPGVEGSTAYLTCAWSFDPDTETAPNITLSSNKRTTIYTYAIGNVYQKSVVKGDDYDSSRMSTSSVNSSISKITLALNDLECADDDAYRCVTTFNDQSGQNKKDELNNEMLIVNTPPSAPILSSLTGNLSLGVMENEPVVFRCTAEAGSPGTGSIHWMVYRGHSSEEISSPNVKVDTEKDVCHEVITSELTWTVGRSDQGAVFACFVSNKFFASAPGLPLACGTSQLCDQAEPMRVILDPAAIMTDATGPAQMIGANTTVQPGCSTPGSALGGGGSDNTVVILWVVIIVLSLTNAALAGLFVFTYMKNNSGDVKGRLSVE